MNIFKSNRKEKILSEFKVKPIEELNLTQDVITTQEELIFKIFGWVIGIVTALTIGLYHDRIEISPLINLVIIIIFMLVAKEHWQTFFRAVEHSRSLEEEINENKYENMRLNKGIRDGEDINIINYKDLYEYKRFTLPYLSLIILVLLSGVMKYHLNTPDKQDLEDISKDVCNKAALVNISNTCGFEANKRNTAK